MNVLKRLTIGVAMTPMMLVGASANAQQSTHSANSSNTIETTPAMATMQMTAPADSVKAAPARSGAPAREAVALRLRSTVNAAAPAPVPRASADSKALMIVGAAGVVTGIIVGGDAGTILVLGGAGIGLYGLYKYMQ